MMIRTPERAYDTIITLRGRYSTSTVAQDNNLDPVVSSFAQLSGQLSPWIGMIQPVSSWPSDARGLTTETILHDFQALKIAHNLCSSVVELNELSKLLLYYLRKIASSLMRIAANNSDVADFYDVTPWGDYAVVPA